MMVLEVGAGAGPYRFNPKAPWGSYVVFLDIGIGPKGLDWVQGDFQALPFRSECFDMVVASHVLEHCENPARALLETRRVLKRGGGLRLWVPNVFSGDARRDPTHRSFFSYLTLKRLLKGAGFRFVIKGCISLPLRRVGIALNAILSREFYVEAWKP